jgi:hypothetical protein
MPYNKTENKGTKRSDTPTAIPVCEFLYELINEHIKPETVLDPCSGDGRLTKGIVCNHIINYEIKNDKDFLQETQTINTSLVICNPPFNIGTGRTLSPEIFMDKILELCGYDVPIILICPMGMRLNQKKSSKRWRKMRDVYPKITSIISLPLDIFENTLFHSEILCFNTPNFDPHYFLKL